MKIGVITPVGPGHEQAYAKCSETIMNAWNHHQGPFKEIELIPMWDLDGQSGRSNKRNSGINLAQDRNCEWIFFLDADDLMSLFAFQEATPYFDSYDAIWGQIIEMPYGNFDQAKLRENQQKIITDVGDLIRYDPYYTLQMGHFVKTKYAREIMFDEELDTGEDFKYYLQICNLCKFIKAPISLFINQRGNHSIGNKSANGAEWRVSVSNEIEKFKKLKLLESFEINTDINSSTAVIVAHPDDEVLWAGGLLSKAKGYDVIVCSIPFKDPERILCFCNAIKFLGHHPIILPFKEQSATIPLENLDLLELNNYKRIYTHNSNGEYGHLHHIQLHNHIKQKFEGELFYFGYGFGNFVLRLTPELSNKKIAAIKHYNNKPANFNGAQTWEVLLKTLRVDFEYEWYISPTHNS